MVPCAIVTDRLASCAAAKAVVMPTVLDLRGRRQNNRVEDSHQPVHLRERGLQRFKSLHAARFCSVFSTGCNQFRPGRHALSAPNLGGPSALQPQSLPTDLEVRGSFAHQTISKSWVVRLAGDASGADWTFSIRVQVVDVFSDDSLAVTFDDWMVMTTRYD